MPTFSQRISFVKKNRSRILEQLQSWIGHLSLHGTFKDFALSTRNCRTELIFNFYFRLSDQVQSTTYLIMGKSKIASSCN